jgi:microcystin degradation protein MlrC
MSHEPSGQTKGKRVLVAGLFHETNGFLQGSTALRDFEILRREELLRVAGDVSPLAGVLEVAGENHWEVLPAIDMRAVPGPIVEDEILDVFWKEFQSVAASPGGKRVDGILLVLHGAMMTRSFADVEGEVLARIRALCGEHCPVCGVLDLHANFTAKMALNSDGLVAYRENPHTDALAAAKNAARLLERLMRTGERTTAVWEHPPVMWPPTGTATATEPMKSLEKIAREIEARNPQILVVNVLAGFAFADIPETGVSLAAVTVGDPEIARSELSRLSDACWAKREVGNVLDPPADDVLRRLPPRGEGPIVLAEPSDNIGAGAPGSGTGLLRDMLEHSVENAAVTINDPSAVRALSKVRPGELARITIGNQASSLYPPPVEMDVELVSRSDGKFELEDPQSHLASLFGMHIDMGPCAVVRHQGIWILLTSRAIPPFDLGQLRSQGLHPETLYMMGVKAAVAHWRAYGPIARVCYSVDTPGPCSSNLKVLPYQNVQRPIYPLDNSRF